MADELLEITEKQKMSREDAAARLRSLATALPGLDHLESQDFQDRVARAVDSSQFEANRSLWIGTSSV